MNVDFVADLAGKAALLLVIGWVMFLAITQARAAKKGKRPSIDGGAATVPGDQQY